MGTAGSEKVMMPIGGIRQGAFITGARRNHPVLLFLHGGPGLPEHALLERHPSRLDEDVVVCWWEQRGAGLSYRGARGAGPITEERLIRDTLEVTDWLRDRFDQERIHLLAHSGGTHIGIQAAARAPERFHSYIGMAQMTRQLESERQAWTWMREQFAQAGDDRMVRRLDRHPMPELDRVPHLPHGVHDRTVSYDLARKYLTTLDAPLKGFYSFPQSAHTPFLEEPDRLQRILREDVLRHRVDLADPVPQPHST